MIFNLCPFLLKTEVEKKGKIVVESDELLNVKNILKFVFAKLNDIELQNIILTKKLNNNFDNKRKSIWARRQSRFPGIELKNLAKKSIFTGTGTAKAKRQSIFQVSETPLEDLEQIRNISIRESLNERSERKDSR
jgi:hypothetical protein